MSLNPRQGQEAIEEARALLAVFRLKLPADLTARTLVRVRARAAQRLAQSASPPVAQWSSWPSGKCYRQAWYHARRPRIPVVASLLLALSMLGWGVFMPQPLARLAGAPPNALPLASGVVPTPPPVHAAAAQPTLAQEVPSAPPLEPQRHPRNKGKRAWRGLRANKA